MKKFLAALMVVVMIFTFSIPKQQANADALVISQLAAAAYAIATNSGLNFAFTAGTAGGAQTFMEERLSSWVGNQSGGISIFGATPVKALAAKLAITQTAFNVLKDFINDFITEESIGSTATDISKGYLGTIPLDTPITDFTQKVSGPWVTQGGRDNGDGTWNHYQNTFGYGSTTKGDLQNNWDNYKGAYWTVKQNSPTQLRFDVYAYKNGATRPVFANYAIIDLTTSATVNDVITATMPSGSMTYPNVEVDDLQTYKRQDWSPDTNLEQMLQDIFEQVADNNLVLTDETIVDTPVDPVPTAAPGDVVGGLDTISGQLEGIDNTLTGVQEGVGEAVGQLEGINEGIGSISEALEVPTASEAPAFKFDLTTLFPFCIPFDIYRFVTMFSASPVAPHVQIPFNIPAISLQYTFDLDFSSFDGVASVLRSVELIAFCVGLAILTSKVIRW